jgi:hypothetical protein
MPRGACRQNSTPKRIKNKQTYVKCASLHFQASGVILTLQSAERQITTTTRREGVQGTWMFHILQTGPNPEPTVTNLSDNRHITLGSILILSSYFAYFYYCDETRTQIGPLTRYVSMKPRWNDNGRGIPKDSEKNLSQCHFVHHRSSLYVRLSPQ